MPTERIHLTSRRTLMKLQRTLLAVVVLSLSSMLLAQSQTAAQSAPAKSDAQISFDALKSLAGEWQGPVSVEPPDPDMQNGKTEMHLTLRVTSRGNALVHEMQVAGTPLDASKYDHPVTMIYLDNDRLNLVHYCDAGNRPHMIARQSADGKKIEFDFTDLSGSDRFGHMYHAVFTILGPDHHTEDWTYMMPGNKPAHVHFDLHRAEQAKLQ
jgi:hypothetical protein